VANNRPVTGLTALLQETWRGQVAGGFLLGDPLGPVEAQYADDPATGVRFRFRWLPHRELRADSAELKSRGIYDPGGEERDLPVPFRDPAGNPCFLCPGMIGAFFPKEILLPVDAGGRRWWAGANFAWLARNHFTVISDRHEGQDYCTGVLAAMTDIHNDTGGAFRVIFNGAGAGASIPWHLHLQMTTEPFPIEDLRHGAEGRYPLTMARFDDIGEADAFIRRWEEADRSHHRVNLLVAGPQGRPRVFVFRRDSRRPTSSEKGLMASFEASGDFVFDGRQYREVFETADLALVYRAFDEIRPPAVG
jgi:hypothetical protein